MPHYRLLLLGENGRILGKVEFQAANDHAAEDEADALEATGVRSLWRGRRWIRTWAEPPPERPPERPLH